MDLPGRSKADGASPHALTAGAGGFFEVLAIEWQGHGFPYHGDNVRGFVVRSPTTVACRSEQVFRILVESCSMAAWVSSVSDWKLPKFNSVETVV